MNSEYNRGDKE